MIPAYVLKIPCPHADVKRNFLLNMRMIVDMLLAITVIAVTLGAVAKLHVGVVGIGLAADSAFVNVALLLVG